MIGEFPNLSADLPAWLPKSGDYVAFFAEEHRQKAEVYAAERAQPPQTKEAWCQSLVEAGVKDPPWAVKSCREIYRNNDRCIEMDVSGISFVKASTLHESFSSFAMKGCSSKTRGLRAPLISSAFPCQQTVHHRHKDVTSALIIASLDSNRRGVASKSDLNMQESS